VIFEIHAMLQKRKMASRNETVSNDDPSWGATAKTVRRGSFLTKAQAVEIYKHKLRIQTQGGAGGSKLRGQSKDISQLYDISSKAVKDIWCHKTWKHATHHLWSPASSGRATDVDDKVSENNEVLMNLIHRP
jgi:hypothetical protein